jgi:hypothetical protein
MEKIRNEELHNYHSGDFNRVVKSMRMTLGSAYMVTGDVRNEYKIRKEVKTPSVT